MTWEIIGIIVSILILSVLIVVNDKDDSFDIERFMRALVSLLFVTLFTLVLTKEHSYKQGQVDAIHGKFKYEMKVDTVMDTSYVEVNKE